MPAILAAVACMFMQDAPGTDRPLALSAMMQARLSLAASDARWSWTRGDGREMFYRSRVASNGDVAYERLGDAGGVLDFSQKGEPNTATSHGYLFKKQTGDTWVYFKGMLTANVTKDSDRHNDPLPVPDVRTLGLTNNFYTKDWLGEDDVLHIDDYPHTFEVQVVDGIHQVSAIADDNSRITWHINPDKGWNAERIVTRHREGQVSGETIISLKQYGETWFPETVVQQSPGGAVNIIQIQRASFNDQAKLRKLSPTDIGLEAGVQLIGAPGKSEREIWDGERSVPAEEWFAAVKKGEKVYGPNVAYTLTHGSSHLVPGAHRQIVSTGGPANLVKTDPWQKYVNKFIREHSFDKTQKQKALQILKQCQSKRGRYWARNTKRLLALRRLSSDRQKQRMAQLREPVKAIFEKDLKPRVAGLLTRAQKARCACHE